MRDWYEDARAKRTREHLARAGVTLPRLTENTATTMMVGFRSWRDTGITWMAIAGVDVAKMQRRAGHDHVGTTMGYVKAAEDISGTIGEPFPPLPVELVKPNEKPNSMSLPTRPATPKEFSAERAGFENAAGVVTARVLMSTRAPTTIRQSTQVRVRWTAMAQRLRRLRHAHRRARSSCARSPTASRRASRVAMSWRRGAFLERLKQRRQRGCVARRDARPIHCVACTARLGTCSDAPSLIAGHCPSRRAISSSAMTGRPAPRSSWSDLRATLGRRAGVRVPAHDSYWAALPGESRRAGSHLVINPRAREHPATMRTASAMASEDEDYIVRLASGDVRAMTITQLDAAFNDGRVGAGTPIVAPGGSGWSTLGELASLEPDDEPASLAPVVTAPVAMPDDAELARIVPRASRFLTLAIVAVVFAALGTVAVLTLRSRVGNASAASATERVEPPTRSVPPPAPPEPAVPTLAPERAASPPPTAIASTTGTPDPKRTNPTRTEDRKKKSRTRHK